MICAITGDDQDNIWISTYRGVSKFNKSEKVFVSYYINDGIKGNEFSRNACFRDKYGNIFLGGLNGITAFDPSVTIDFEHKADLFLTGFYLNDKNINTDYLSDGKPIIEKSVSESEEFSLSHKDNSFALEFSSLSYNNDSREKLSYSVNNGGWHTLEPGIKRIYFNNMSPGKYKIRVKSVDYNAESDIKEYLVDVRPAVYFSFWAKMIYLFLFVSLLGFIFYMFRLRILSKKELNEHMQMEQINESKLQFFMNISHEIRTPMSLIVSPLEKLMDNDPDPERNRSYSIIYRNTQRILRLINQLMDEIGRAHV